MALQSVNNWGNLALRSDSNRLDIGTIGGYCVGRAQLGRAYQPASCIVHADFESVCLWVTMAKDARNEGSV
jgi:hypothetical protein